MSGVFAALFGTPLTATIFALEVISVGVLYYAGLLPCFTASLTGYYIALVMGVEPTRFTVAMPALEWGTLGLTALLAVGCALVSILFCRGLHITEHAAACWMKNGFVRAAVGGAVIVLACIVFSAFAASDTVVLGGGSVVTQVWGYLGEVIFNMLVLVGLVKGADRVVREMFGM